MNQLIEVHGVKGYIDNEGTAHLNLEDVARGLGFTTVATSGNDYIRWQTVRRYLGDLGFLQEVAKEDLPEFIPENIFYRLAMKAKNQTAETFQAKVADEILPSIRKTGSYSVVDTSQLSPELQMFKQIWDGQVRMQLEQAETQRKLESMESTVFTIQETFMKRDEDWRTMINGMMKGASYRRGGDYRELRNLSYQQLEDRAKCDLAARVRNLKQRLLDSGATKTQYDGANRMDVIEADPRLKEIYTSIVKEMSIGTLAVMGR